MTVVGKFRYRCDAIRQADDGASLSKSNGSFQTRNAGCRFTRRNNSRTESLASTSASLIWSAIQILSLAKAQSRKEEGRNENSNSTDLRYKLPSILVSGD